MDSTKGNDCLEDVKITINFLTLFGLRRKTFAKELKFFEDDWPRVSQNNEYSRGCYLGALRRLGHEVMFLCIETYSLHKGIVHRKDSLAVESIKQNSMTDEQAVEDWAKSMWKDENIQKLNEYRSKYFAHRFDTLEKIKNNSGDILQPSEIKEILTVIDETLSMYREKLQKFLSCTCAEHYEGIAGSYYDSFDRLELAQTTSTLRRELLAK